METARQNRRLEVLGLLVEHAPQLAGWLGSETLAPEDVEKQRQFWAFVDALAAHA